MIKAHGTFGEHPFILVGLSAANIDRLLDNQPIVFDARDLDPQLSSMSIIITAGVSESTILADVQRAFGEISEVRWE